MSKIYGLVDKSLLLKFQVNIKDLTAFLNRNSIQIIQYRNKSPKNRDEILEDISDIRKYYEGKLIINDYLEFIELVDGVHLGQEDLKSIDVNPYNAVSKVRDKIKDKVLGLSTHNLKEIQIANSLKVDYIGLGSYRTTETKSGVNILGETLLEYAKKSNKPVAIIGGVKLKDNFLPKLQ